MTTIKRAGRAPALLLTLLTVAVAALVLTLSTTGGSTAAPAFHATAARPAHVAARPAAHPAARAATPATPAADDHSGDSPAQMYLTDTPERRGELIHTWDVCLIDNGATQDTTRAAVAYQGHHVPLAVADPVPPSASAACQDKLPLLPKEENPQLNPDYVADSAANVACLRAHGVDVHTVSDTSVFPDGLSWTYDSDDTQTPANEGQLENACMLQAFQH